MPMLESPSFDVLWLKSTVTGPNIRLLPISLPLDSDHVSLFSYLADKIELINSALSKSQIILLGDFNVHNSAWLQYSGITNAADREAEAFTTSHDLTQLLIFPTNISDRSSQSAYTLDPFLTSDPENFSISSSAPLGNSDHCLIKVIRPDCFPSLQNRTCKRLRCYKSADRADHFFRSCSGIRHF